MNDSCSMSMLLRPCARLKVVTDQTWRSTNCSVGAARVKKPTEPNNNHVRPWITGRKRVAPPRATRECLRICVWARQEGAGPRHSQSWEVRLEDAER